ncbi:unnamed protein product [Lactuca virosa]|uniref:Uncharacterized protein n=1 Tax=Lactuca virosa TaxID=75947 RepID=A0AAU9LHN4_9ASTR|nr:unnamed protein product [Lactuca virosa]
MRKSQGKWIQTILLGKRSSKSNLYQDTTLGNKTSITAKATSNDFVNNSMISSSVPLVTHASEEHTELAKTSSVNLTNSTSEVARSTTGLNTENEDEFIRLEQAAIKAQAAVRGYSARRTFLSLNGIILLQAYIRGHLARKQLQPQVRTPNLDGNLVISAKTKESKQSLRKISISMAVASEQGPPQPQPASKPNSEPEPEDELPMNVESNWKENLKTSGATKQSKTSDLNYTISSDACVGFDLNEDEIEEKTKKKASSVGLTGYNTYLEKMAEEFHVFNSNFNVYMEYKKEKLRKKEKAREEKQRTEDLKVLTMCANHLSRIELETALALKTEILKKYRMS